jgi:glucosamine--fructose-6-phosphate aminotransferase (isomerizing)
MSNGQHTYREITSQPGVWSEVLDSLLPLVPDIADRWQRTGAKRVLFTGCGSTYYLSLTAAALFQGLTGVPARGVPASEIVLFPDETLSQPQDTLLIAVSRSGTTTETAAAMSRFRQLGGNTIWGVTCYPDTPVATETDFALLAEAAQETSVAQTRSFSSMLLIIEAVSAIAGGQQISSMNGLPDAAERILDEYADLAEQLGQNSALSRFFFLGSGPLYGIACEVMLKMKEMSISHSEAFHFMEFRHGPKSLVDEHGLVTGLLSPRSNTFEEPVVKECMEMGGRALTLFPRIANSQAHYELSLASDAPWWAQPVLYLPMLQLLAYQRSMSKGLDPDNPRHLTAVVELDRDSLLAGNGA